MHQWLTPAVQPESDTKVFSCPIWVLSLLCFGQVYLVTARLPMRVPAIMMKSAALLWTVHLEPLATQMIDDSGIDLMIVNCLQQLTCNLILLHVFAKVGRLPSHKVNLHHVQVT